MLTGSAFRANIAAPAERFRILTGKPREYVKTADSGARAPQDTRTYSLRLGALSEKEALGRPARQDLDQAPPVMDTAGRRRAGGRRPALTPVDFRAARSTRE